MRFPSGDQSGWSPPFRLHGVSWRSPEPSVLTTNSARRFGGSAVFRFCTSNTSRFPSGDQAGLFTSIENGLSAVTSVTWRRPLPLAFITEISVYLRTPSRTSFDALPNASCFPFGDQVGVLRSLHAVSGRRRQSGPRRFASVPSALTVQTSQLVSEHRSKAIRAPSGDQSGFVSSERLTCGSLRAPLPSGLITQRVGNFAYTICPFFPGEVPRAGAATVVIAISSSAKTKALLTTTSSALGNAPEILCRRPCKNLATGLQE